jgi:hypothetical protein
MLAVHDRETWCWTAVTPVPLRAIESVGFVALLVTVIAPVKVPVTVGIKDAVSVVVEPAAIVNGVVIEARENPAPETETEETVTGPVPMFVSVTVNDEVVLSCTFPKFRLGGVAVSGPGVVPVPLSGMERFGSDALLVILIAPVATPTAAGAKEAVSVRVAFGARVNGVVTDASEKPTPEIETALTVNEALPVFVRVTVCDRDVLTFTFPKLTDVGEAVSVPCRCADTISTAA